ncbi:MAG: hypothetical protein JXP37_06995, partial [Coriobacteriia bacterium]|nr:hypothetical protein [Coriobacteriia bacterium]
MNLASASDLVAFLSYAAACLIVVLIPSRARGMGRGFKFSLLAALGLLLFVSTSNVLEHAGITSVLDAYEDYAEVLFVPLVAYILYSRSTAEQLVAARTAENATRREHELLMSVVDTTPAGIMVADSSGDVRFSNDAARQLIEATGRWG